MTNNLTVCVPAGKLVFAEPIDRILTWIQGNKKKVYKNVFFKMEISNRVDLNRSSCVYLALNRESDLLMIDSDVVPTKPFDEVMEQLRKDVKEAKADVVIGLIASRLGLLGNNINPMNRLSEPTYASLGFTFMPLKTLLKLKVLGYYRFPSGNSVPMYFTYTTVESEDIEFINRIRKQGLKVVMDRSIDLDHYNIAPIKLNPIYREEIEIEVENEDGSTRTVNGNELHLNEPTKDQ